MRWKASRILLEFMRVPPFFQGCSGKDNQERNAILIVGRKLDARVESASYLRRLLWTFGTCPRSFSTPAPQFVNACDDLPGFAADVIVVRNR